MAAVNPDGTRTPDFQNPAAIRYALQMLRNLVRSGLIGSVGSATSKYGGDPTAAWRALSGLTGAPHTTTMYGAGAPNVTAPTPPPLPPNQAMTQLVNPPAGLQAQARAVQPRFLEHPALQGANMNMRSPVMPNQIPFGETIFQEHLSPSRAWSNIARAYATRLRT